MYKLVIGELLRGAVGMVKPSRSHMRLSIAFEAVSVDRRLVRFYRE